MYAETRDQFRCIDLRAPFSAKAITLSEATERGESLGQYAHGHLMDDYFAYPIGEELHM